jgi:perosamine synthetase
MIRLTIPSISEEDLQAVQSVLASGYLVQGQHVAAFEKVVANYVGVEYAIAVSNCTAALHLTLLALNVGAGDLVLVTAYSWPATANVIELCGAQPVFIDIEPDTFNMDPVRLAETVHRLMRDAATAGRVKAILPVHTFGQMADMPAIMEVAHQYRLPVVEDAACALGAKLNHTLAGTWGKMGCFSFHPRKAITTGEGGIITTNDAALASRLRALRNHGLDPDAPSPEFILPGFNYRLTEFQAAFGLSQMAKVDRIIGARQKLAARYRALLSTSITPPATRVTAEPVYQSYVVSLPETHSPRRATIIEQLKVQGIETTIGTWHIPLTRYYRQRYNYQKGDFPITDSVFSRSLTLPLYEGLSEGEIEQVAMALNNLLV